VVVTSPVLRRAAVAGTFYPASPSELAALVDSFLTDARRPRLPALAPKAIVAPHAGYVYSGPIAGMAYAALSPAASRIRRVVLLGPAHRVRVRGLALPGVQGFRTPLGDVGVDDRALASIGGLRQISTSALAHAQEHSLEVQLPFLQRVLGDFSLVPLVVGDASPDEVAEVLEQLWGGDETLVVVSSDLSHYLPHDVAQRLDASTAQRLVEGNLVEATDACGAAPVNGLLVAAHRHGLRCVALDLRSSGDTAGPRDEVVGYGAFAFYAPGAIPEERSLR
jgi:AmmeMemoRadiSam system protein B